MSKSNFLSYRIFLLLYICVISTSCNNQKFEQGKKLYETHCESCHQSSGEGLAKLYPPLKDSDYWKNNQDLIPCILRKGLSDTIIVNGSTYTTEMAGIPQLTAYEISNIINYINYSWYDNLGEIDFKQIKEGLDQCK